MKNLILLFVCLGTLAFGQSISNTSNTGFRYVVAQDSIFTGLDSATATLTYAANDVVNDTTTSWPRLFRFKYSTRPGSAPSGRVLSVTLIVTDTNNIANGTFRLNLFSDTVKSVANNGAWVRTARSDEFTIGSVDLTLSTYSDSSAIAVFAPTDLPFISTITSTSNYIYGVLVARAAYKRASGSKIKIKLGIERD